MSDAGEVCERCGRPAVVGSLCAAHLRQSAQEHAAATGHPIVTEPETVDTEIGGEWAGIVSYDDACRLTAAWFDDPDEDSHPVFMVEPGPHERAVLPTLAQACRAGLLVAWWSVASPVGANERRRAALTAFCPPGRADGMRLLGGADVTTAIWRPSLAPVPVEPPLVATDRQLPTEAVGGLSSALDIMVTWGVVAGLDELAVTLAGLDRVVVVDPVWGRDDVLWPALLDAAEGRTS